MRSGAESVMKLYSSHGGCQDSQQLQSAEAYLFPQRSAHHPLALRPKLGEREEPAMGRAGGGPLGMEWMVARLKNFR